MPSAEAATADDVVARLERRLARAREENQILEKLIEDKTRSLYLAQQEQEKSRRFLQNVLRSMDSAVMITDEAGVITTVGGATPRLTGLAEDALVGRTLSTILTVPETPDSDDPTIAGRGATVEGELLSRGEATIPVLVTTSQLSDEDEHRAGAVHVATDIRERKRLEVELGHAQRLESIGQLAAGVAHEINTPIQFVSDSVRFIGEVLEDLMDYQQQHDELRAVAASVDGGSDLISQLEAKAEEIDLEFVKEETPKAVTRTVDGLNRVATIVKALKQFSHPGTDEMAPADLNRIVENTLTVAKNEYKYVAEVEIDLCPDAEVICHPGDLGQVLINLVVNAAHAVGDQVDGSGQLGKISLRTFSDSDGLVVEVADTGGGIPAELRNRVFEPFFTTKEPGKGSGQGLALAHNVVVNKHKGRMSFDVDEGVGTTFRIWLPKQRAE